MTEQEQRFPTLLDLFKPSPHSVIKLEVRTSGERAILFAVEESNEIGRCVYTFPVLGGSLNGVRRSAADLLVKRPDIEYREIELTTHI